MTKIEKTDKEWKKELSEESFNVARLGGTERPFSGKYWNFEESTQPGTDIKVTPDNDAPTIPKATKYQGEFRLALKNTSLESSFTNK